jgi:hypothetical protein
MMEGISYMAGSELPAVIVNIMRAGPGLGGILRPRATTCRRPREADTATTACSCWRRGPCRRRQTWCRTPSTSPTTTATR